MSCACANPRRGVLCCPCCLLALPVLIVRCLLPVGSFHLPVSPLVPPPAPPPPEHGISGGPLLLAHAWRGHKWVGFMGKPLLGSGSGRTVYFPPCKTWVLTVTVTCTAYHRVRRDSIVSKAGLWGPRVPSSTTELCAKVWSAHLKRPKGGKWCVEAPGVGSAFGAQLVHSS